MLEKIIDGLKYSIKYDKSILRRYLILGAFDGILLATGVLISAAASKLSIQDTNLAVLSGIIAIAISSMWNSLVVEAKERKLEYEQLERQMMKRLKGTIYDYGMKSTIVLSVISHGLSPFLGVFAVIVYDYTKDIFYGILISLVILFILGLSYEGDLREKLQSGVIIIIAGIITVLITMLINH